MIIGQKVTRHILLLIENLSLSVNSVKSTIYVTIKPKPSQQKITKPEK